LIGAHCHSIELEQCYRRKGCNVASYYYRTMLVNLMLKAFNILLQKNPLLMYV